MTFEGALDVCNDDLVAGWAWDRDRADHRLAIDLIVDEVSLARLTADQYRADLEAAGIGDGRYAFAYPPLSRLGLGGRKVRAVIAGSDFALPRSRPAIPGDRRERVTRFITPQQRGIEIGPYFNPLTPKRLGYDCLVLDVFDAETLRRHAREDANIPAEAIADIEEVDIVASGIEIAERVAEKHPLGSFDYILSSHNFEHLPDPIRFLQGCEKVLRPAGILSMAVPDRRTCFDYFRPHSTLAEMIEAYQLQRVRPTAAQVFAQNALHSRYVADGRQLVGFPLDADPANVVPLETLAEAFTAWQAFAAQPDDVYHDVHCWAFTPASLALLLHDLRFLGLLRLQTREISETQEMEFYVHLANPAADEHPPQDGAAFYAERQRLLHQANDEAGRNSTWSYLLQRDFAAERDRLQQRIAELERRSAGPGE